MPLRDAALLILGHGSTLNADSSAPTYQHAEEIRRRGIFADVQVAFWKEEPNFRQALRQTGCGRVFVVPNFISSGYFTEQVIPRELGLTGPVTRIGTQEVCYCPPVGLHPSMTEALLRKAREVVIATREIIADHARTACLFICGHGTSLNDNSTKIIHDQVELIRARGLFADCQGVLMEQAPFVKDWRSLTPCDDVIVVPFFISDGLHSFEDIPVLLGLTDDVKKMNFANPHREAGRRLWYATALGTDPFIADVILAQVKAFQEENQLDPLFAVSPASVSAESLDFFFRKNPPPWTIGQLRIDPGYTIRHVADAGYADLRRLESLDELRELIRIDESWTFRPLRAAPDLKRGWIYEAPDLESLGRALDYLYPAEIANWALWLQEELPITPWKETAERQSGRFRIVRDLNDAAVMELVDEVCQKGCLKRRLWEPAAQKVEAATGEIPLLCPEACNYLVGKAREKLKGPGDD
jgi:sirohydrochlorin cobaltochelatase